MAPTDLENDGYESFMKGSLVDEENDQALISVDTSQCYGSSELPPGALMTTKIPPSFDGSSWFVYEDLLDDWEDITVIDEETRGPLVRNRLTGEAAIYKRSLDRDSKTKGWYRIHQEYPTP